MLGVWIVILAIGVGLTVALILRSATYDDAAAMGTDPDRRPADTPLPADLVRYEREQWT